MGNDRNAAGKRVFNDIYSFPQDSQDLADDVYDAHNVRRGPSSERATYPTARLREGLIWVETDTRISYAWFSATGWQPTDAMVLLAQQSFASTGIVNFDNVFSSRFANYLIRVNIRSMSTGGIVAFQMRVNGQNATGSSDYRTTSQVSSAATVTAATTGEDRAPLNKTNVGAVYSEIRLFDPAIAARTAALIKTHCVLSATAAEQADITAQHNPATAYDGFRIITSGPALTGTISVFGIG
jgi:hypothetical protein